MCLCVINSHATTGLLPCASQWRFNQYLGRVSSNRWYLFPSFFPLSSLKSSTDLAFYLVFSVFTLFCISRSSLSFICFLARLCWVYRTRTSSLILSFRTPSQIHLLSLFLDISLVSQLVRADWTKRSPYDGLVCRPLVGVFGQAVHLLPDSQSHFVRLWALET